MIQLSNRVKLWTARVFFALVMLYFSVSIVLTLLEIV